MVRRSELGTSGAHLLEPVHVDARILRSGVLGVDLLHDAASNIDQRVRKNHGKSQATIVVVDEVPTVWSHLPVRCRCCACYFSCLARCLQEIVDDNSWYSVDTRRLDMKIAIRREYLVEQEWLAHRYVVGRLEIFNIERYGDSLTIADRAIDRVRDVALEHYDTTRYRIERNFVDIDFGVLMVLVLMMM